MALGTDRLLPLLAEMHDARWTMPLAAVAEAASLSPEHLQRIFAAEVGESPARYQQRLRLELGAIELRSTELRIIDIAIGAGFESHEAFTRAFTARFGLSPSTYRKQSTPIDDSSRRVTASTGPCVGLYRVALSSGTTSLDNKHPTHSKEHHMPAPQISRESIEEIPTLVSRRRVDRAQIAEALAECLPAAFGHAMAAGLTMAGPPFVRYVDESVAFVSIEAGVPLTAPAGSIDAPDLFASALPGGEAAVAIHVGPYETLGETHMAIDRWIDENNLTSSGGPWEIYLTDPGEVPDPNDWQTQIVWPIT